MMNPLYQKPIDLNPGIKLDKRTEKFEIFGISCPSNAFEFYDPLFKWFEEYFLDPLEYTALDLKLEYFNTSTAKFLYIIMSKLEKMYNAGHNVEIRWYYSEYDEDMLEEGEEFENIIDLPFELIPVKSDENDNVEEDDNVFFDHILGDTY